MEKEEVEEEEEEVVGVVVVGSIDVPKKLWDELSIDFYFLVKFAWWRRRQGDGRRQGMEGGIGGKLAGRGGSRGRHGKDGGRGGMETREGRWARRQGRETGEGGR